MTDEDDDEDDVATLEQRAICSDCVREEFLRDEIRREGKSNTCFFCKGVNQTISLGDLTDYVATAFEQHYVRTPIEPDGVEYIMLKEGGVWERHGEQAVYAIADAASIDEGAAEQIRKILNDRLFDVGDMGDEESEFDEQSYYDESGVEDYELQTEWQEFQNSLKTEARLFNPHARATLDWIFANLEAHRTSDGRSAIVTVGPGQNVNVLYRARVFQSDEKLKTALARPDIEIGPPPSRHAIAGRMNSQGISVFYGATDSAVALAETRPPVGSKVVVGRFEIIRPLSLLDIEVLRAVYVKGSIFDRSFQGRLVIAKFLRTVSQRIAEPVMPDDEPFEYIVTQAIADYLAGRKEPSIDGIIYPSVQDGARNSNIVLFHKSSRVEKLEFPPRTAISAFTHQTDEDGPAPDYRVYEETPPEKPTGDATSEEGLSLLFARDPIDYSPSDTRDATLRVDLKSIWVHHVRDVVYGTESFEVRRHRFESRDVKY